MGGVGGDGTAGIGARTAAGARLRSRAASLAAQVAILRAQGRQRGVAAAVRSPAPVCSDADAWLELHIVPRAPASAQARSASRSSSWSTRWRTAHPRGDPVHPRLRRQGHSGAATQRSQVLAPRSSSTQGNTRALFGLLLCCAALSGSKKGAKERAVRARSLRAREAARGLRRSNAPDARRRRA